VVFLTAFATLPKRLIFLTKLFRKLCLSACLAAAAVCHAADSAPPAPVNATAASATVKLPGWQVLEFEQKAFWAVASSRLEVRSLAEDPRLWELDVLNSVVDNSEQITVRFEPGSGRAISRTRLSRGQDQRMKTYQYGADSVLRERRVPGSDANAPPQQWPVAKSEAVPYPRAADGAVPVVTSPYVLVLLAQDLQAQGENKSLEVMVNTDLNFYRVRLNSGTGGPIDVDYQKNGGARVNGKIETSAVVLSATPAGTPKEGADFSLFGLQGDVILLFDRSSGLPVQVRGTAPRIGDTAINLKAVTLRESTQ
jgi:hypothetical protein